MEIPLIILVVMGCFAGVSVAAFWTIIMYVMFARGRTRAEADAQYEALSQTGQSIQTEVCQHSFQDLHV